MKHKSEIFAPILFGVILILAGVSSMLVTLLNRFASEPFLALSVIQLLVYFLPLSFYLLARGLRPTAVFHFTPVSLKKIPFLIVMTLLCFAGILLFRYFGVFYFDPAFLDTPSAVFIPKEAGNEFLMFFASILLPAILEETVFRGALLEEYRKFGVLPAVFMTSVMYAMLHLNPKNFAFDFFVGAVLGMMTMLSDSLFPAVVLQVLLKTSNRYFRPQVVDYLRQAGKSMLLPYLLIALFIVTVILLMARLETYYQNRAYDEMMQSRKELLLIEVEKAKQERNKTKEKETKPSALSSWKKVLLSPAFLVTMAVYVCLAWNVFQF